MNRDIALERQLSATAARALAIAGRILSRASCGFRIRLWSGEEIAVGRGEPSFALVFREPRALRSLLLGGGALALAESYLRGELDVDGDLDAALRLKDELPALELPLRTKLAALATGLMLPRHTPGAHCHSARLRADSVQRHTQAENKGAIAFHYDVSNDFYRLWLDERMVYSCAYFRSADESLEQAQMNKLDHICRKLMLAPGERFLDVGCGWGALVIWAAQHYGVQAHGITLSREQHALAQRRVREARLERRVRIDLLDYRRLEGEAAYDKIASVGMFEHVGLKNLPVYFRTAHRLLKPAGLFLNHGITHEEDGWSETLSTRFINRYVFPDGELDRVSNVQREMESARFEIHDVEGLRPHYALTLRHWVRRLEARREQALKHVSEAVYRVWRLYMTACARQFEQGDVGVYQILASRRAPYARPLPLTRDYMYPAMGRS